MVLLGGMALADSPALRGYTQEEGYVYLTLGEYPQTAEGEVQPILWRVLKTEEEHAYLLSEYILFARPMHITQREVSTDKLKADYSRVDYRDELQGKFAQTELCTYLNHTFADQAFTAEELEMLQPCEDFGKVFLISLEEIKDKALGLGSTNPGTTSAKKIAENPGCRAWGTAWAIHNNGVSPEEFPDPKARTVGLAGEHVSVEETRLYVFQSKFGACSPWWARTQSSTDGRHAVATKDGGQIGHIEVARDNIGVRPAVYLRLDAFQIAGGSGTMEDPYQIAPKNLTQREQPAAAQSSDPAPEERETSGESAVVPVVKTVQAKERTSAGAMVRNGGSFVYVAREDGTIVGWGDNRMGQLGTTPAKLLLTPRPVADGINAAELADIQCGNENTLFLKKDGTVYTCGTYGRGAQGLGKLDHIVKEPTRIPDLENIVQISCGFGHNAALDAEGHIWIWGRNDYGQLGMGDKTARNRPVMLPLENIVYVNCGGKFTLAQDAEGKLWGWGSNTHQVLFPTQTQVYSKPMLLEGFEEKRIVAFSGGSDCAFWLDDQGTIWTRGRNEYKQLGSSDAKWKISGQLTTVDIPEKVSVVCAYSAATAALTENGNVYIWGSVSAGQLGTGKSPNGTLPVLVWDTGDAVEVAMGSLISSVRTEDGKVYVSGYNAYGQLGDGSTRSSNQWTWNGTTVK